MGWGHGRHAGVAHVPQAISAWRENTGYGRVQLVKSYFRAVDGFSEPKALTKVPGADDSQPSQLPGPLRFLERFMARTANDPFYAVIAKKQ